MTQIWYLQRSYHNHHIVRQKGQVQGLVTGGSVVGVGFRGQLGLGVVLVGVDFMGFSLILQIGVGTLLLIASVCGPQSAQITGSPLLPSSVTRGLHWSGNLRKFETLRSPHFEPCLLVSDFTSSTEHSQEWESHLVIGQHAGYAQIPGQSKVTKAHRSIDPNTYAIPAL